MKITKNLIIILVALGCIAGPASSLEAGNQKPEQKKESRQKSRHDGTGARIAGAALGGTAVGVGVGVKKGAWGILGAAGGALVGYGIVRAIQKGRNNRDKKQNKELKRNKK